MLPTQWPRNLRAASFLLVARVERCQDGEVIPVRADHALLGQRTLVPIETGRVAQEIDEVLACALPRPIGPVARRAKRGELIIQLNEGDHSLAGGIVQLSKCQLADRLMTEAAPGQG
jgi:hypothetical protein